MQFKCMSIGEFSYGDKETDPDFKNVNRNDPAVTNVQFSDHSFYDHMFDQNHQNNTLIH